MIYNCQTCADYLERRAAVLAPHIATRAFIRGVSGEVVAWEYMHGVHRRHLCGKSLATDGTA